MTISARQRSDVACQHRTIRVAQGGASLVRRRGYPHVAGSADSETRDTIMLRSAAAPTDRALGETNASGTVLPPQRGWRINEGWFSRYSARRDGVEHPSGPSTLRAGWRGTQVLFAMALAGIVMGLVAARQEWRTWQALLAGVLVGSLLAYTGNRPNLPDPAGVAEWHWHAQQRYRNLDAGGGDPRRATAATRLAPGSHNGDRRLRPTGSLRGRSWPGTGDRAPITASSCCSCRCWRGAWGTSAPGACSGCTTW